MLRVHAFIALAEKSVEKQLEDKELRIQYLERSLRQPKDKTMEKWVKNLERKSFPFRRWGERGPSFFLFRLASGLLDKSLSTWTSKELHPKWNT